MARQIYEAGLTDGSCWAHALCEADSYRIRTVWVWEGNRTALKGSQDLKKHAQLSLVFGPDCLKQDG